MLNSDILPAISETIGNNFLIGMGFVMHLACGTDFAKFDILTIRLHFCLPK